jgi:hypothetical protein
MNVDKLAPANKWRLISLLVDTPISKAEKREIISSLKFFEKIGQKELKLLRKPMDKDAISHVLEQACNGTLHYFTVEQGRRNDAHRRHALFKACLIAFCTNLPVGLWENFVIYWSATNGLQDA